MGCVCARRLRRAGGHVHGCLASRRQRGPTSAINIQGILVGDELLRRAAEDELQRAAEEVCHYLFAPRSRSCQGWGSAIFAAAAAPPPPSDATKTSSSRHRTTAAIYIEGPKAGVDLLLDCLVVKHAQKAPPDFENLEYGANIVHNSNLDEGTSFSSSPIALRRTSSRGGVPRGRIHDRPLWIRRLTKCSSLRVVGLGHLLHPAAAAATPPPPVSKAVKISSCRRRMTTARCNQPSPASSRHCTARSTTTATTTSTSTLVVTQRPLLPRFHACSALILAELASWFGLVWACSAPCSL